ncbi:MAG: translation initiation factor IF-2 N-terminal domain-containing protein, partial [Candidatus Omnitrophica bacterium]|nr:translation initiation factor IF-2 N-terminal domain-containing protein [Candidatus Omnitrophota bacterium]
MIKKAKEKKAKEIKKKSPAKISAAKSSAAKKPVIIKSKPVKKVVKAAKPAKEIAKKDKLPGIKIEPAAKKEIPVAVKTVEPPPIKPRIVVPEPPKRVEPPVVKHKEAPKVEPIVKPVVEEVIPPAEEVKARLLELDLPIALKDLAAKIGVKSNELIMKLMARNIFATINQGLGEEMVKELLKDYSIEFRKPVKVEAEAVKEHRDMEDKQDVKNIV